MSVAPPPQALTVDEYSAADAARQRFVKKTRFPISLPNLHSSNRLSKARPDSIHSSAAEFSVAANEEESEDPPELPIRFRRPTTVQYSDDYTDKYQWAVLYENQRGMTLFSIPYYSKLSLLPNDPYPFTIPTTSNKRSAQPNYTPSDYPLPDGNWRWVSKAWMIDMQNDSGHVQHDGFEYNWCFQKHHWRAKVGSLSFVRRRRWIRLMMRPAKVSKREDDSDHLSPPATLKSNKLDELVRRRASLGSTLHPPSVISAMSDFEGVDVEVLDSVWLGDDTDTHWSGYCSVMKIMGQDDAPLPSEYRVQEANIRGQSASLTRREVIEAVLREHGADILHSFVYPDSRAQLLKMLKGADLLSALMSNETVQQSPSMVDFWSYVS
ncbi:hypothetical protein BDZ89DRAFT_1059005 [Hymenopellis radicata]|nr:hypothetical protein BDZ89DRAFT_1059005 [Hymenopellis radicata]